LGSKRIEVKTSTFRGHVTIRFPIGHFLCASSDSFFRKTHHVATIHKLTLQTTDEHNTTARPLVRSAKNGNQ